MPNCWSCGKKIELNHFSRLDSCLHCKSDTHACKNCFFYDTAFHNACTETSADRVVEKEKANFCDFFKPGEQAGGNALSQAEKARAAAEALFRKK